MSGLSQLATAFLRKLDPEQAHGLAIAGLKTGLARPSAPFKDAHLHVTVFGLDFPNPIGLAAGFDKSAEVPDAMLAHGFGFVEVGTVTPRPQAGNPRPRLFRLAEDRAVINRMGFNNDGHEAVHRRLKTRPRSGIVGVNIGANKDASDRVGDYITGLAWFHDVADYLTVNISSPNTPGLRGLQDAGALKELLSRLADKRADLQSKTPVLVKIAPDLEVSALEDICSLVAEANMDGLIISNTTITRPESLTSHHAVEAGGLSGEPLFEASTRMLAHAYTITEGKLPLIGVGGIATPQQAIEKLKAGASLIQLYSGMVFEGPAIAKNLACAISDHLAKSGDANVDSLTGSGVSNWL